MDVYVSYTACTGHNTNTNVNTNTTSSFNNPATTNNNILHQTLLECLNKEKATLYIPVIVFLIVLIVTGTLGNLLVCCVYWRKPYKASSHYFILSLAILDLFSCLIGLPTEIADLSFPYIFNMPVACKVLRFTHSSTIIASSTILIQVAFDRYFRICKLGQQFSVRKAKLLVYHGHPSGGTIYPTIYYLFLFTLFFLTITFFAVLYSRIGVAIWRRKRKTIGSKVVTKMNSHRQEERRRRDDPARQEETNPRRKTTTVLFAVTLAYILSFLPYLVVMILRSTIKDFEGRLSPVGEVAYKFCVKSFFINNAINPLIYSFLNAGFRKDVRQALKKMFHNCLCRKLAHSRKVPEPL
nr:hypothetical protein BaRGS_017849 [Batillaria attramentaria]